jgi:hypothetical protein
MQMRFKLESNLMGKILIRNFGFDLKLIGFWCAKTFFIQIHSEIQQMKLKSKIEVVLGVHLLGAFEHAS